MKTLLALRHAKSSWRDPELDDHERPLSARGRRDAPRVGALIREHRLTLDLIISSDAVRARLTAEAVAAHAGYDGEILLEPSLYLASAAGIVTMLRKVRDAKAERVLIVGHNPGLEELLARLTGEEDDLPTAALAQIALPIGHWSGLTLSTRGALVAVWRPTPTGRNNG